MKSPAPLPFTGLRVLDISQGVAGPYCAQILWQQGAEVVKVEPPEGDWGRHLGTVRGEHSALSITYNAGKQGICLDAKHAEGKAVLRKLALQADIVVQNFRPGVAERLGVGYESLAEHRPDLVYVSISGYGADGPYANAPASDSVMQADTGLMFANQDESRTPRRIGLLLADISTGLYAAQATAAALYRKLSTGDGSHVELSLFEACAALQSSDFTAYAIAGERPAGAVSAPNGIFATADGSLSVLALNNDQFARLCRALGTPQWLENPRFADNDSRMANRSLIHAELASLLATATTRTWTDRLEAEHVLHAPVRDFAGVGDHPQARHLGLFEQIDQAGVGIVPLPRYPGLGQRRDFVPAPGLGEHTRRILERCCTESEIDALLASGAVRQSPR